MKPALVALLVAAALSACSSTDDSPQVVNDDPMASEVPANPVDVENPVDPNDPGMPANPENPEQPGAPDPVDVGSLATPAFKGELVFSDVQTLAIEPILSEAGLSIFDAYPSMSRDGKTVRIDVTGETGQVAHIALVDTTTLEYTWMVRDISNDTRLLLDANHNIVAATAVACQPISYTSVAGATPADLEFDLADGYCIGNELKLSANGNVAVFTAYDPVTGDQFVAPDSTQYAYTVDTANLVELGGTDFDIDGTTFSPRNLFLTDRERFLSDDGTQYFNMMWWQGIDANGVVLRQVGAALWDTATGVPQFRGLREDLRDCDFSPNEGCLPPYSYLMSEDGNVQYSEVPTDQMFNLTDGSPFTRFSTRVEQSVTFSPSPVELAGVSDSRPATTNNNGSLVLLNTERASDTLAEGFHLYKPETGEVVSLNRALNSCPEFDDAGETIDPESCEFNGIPYSITNEGEHFTAGGNVLFINAISRLDNDNNQSVKGFMLDVVGNEVYTVPENFLLDIDYASADASVFVTQTGFPEYDLIIGKR